MIDPDATGFDLRSDAKLVYIARAVDHRTADASARDAEHIASALRAQGIDSIDPVKTPFPGYSGRNILSDFDRVNSDLAWLKKCDAILVDLRIPDWPYVGCICELVYARFYDIPAVVVSGDSHVGNRIWLQYHADEITSTIEAAVDYIHALPKGARPRRPA